MSNTIIELRHSYVTGNVPSSLANGEIAINTYDGKLFYRGGVSNTIQIIERYEGPAGLNTEIQFNDSGVLGSDSDLSFNKTTDVLSAKNIVVSGNSYFGNANLHEGITQLSVTNAGAGAYLFDQYTGSNPSLYVGAGETLSFNLNVSGHPFLIRESSGGANISAGLTHISTTGVVSTGADAQGKISGVLYWKVPFSLVGSTYVYQCAIHGGMVGNIVIQQPASFVAANTTLAFNTANAAFLAANAATATDTTQNNSITAAFTAANSAGVYANSAFAAANAATATDTTQNNSITAAFTAANSAGVYANGAFAAANSAGSSALAQAAFNTANASFISANSAGVYANGAFAAANAATAIDTTQNNSITAAFIHANASFAFANTISGGSAIDNVARSLANTAQITATAAFAQANTDVTNITISPSQTYGNATHSPIITVSANGRINAISTVAVTATDPSAIAFAIALG